MTPQEIKEAGISFDTICRLAFEIQKHADYMARWCFACPRTISPERFKTMKREINILLPTLGRATNSIDLVRANNSIYDAIKDL